MAQIIETKKGDLLPVWTFQVKRKDASTGKWELDDLSDVTEVLIYMKNVNNGTIKIDGSVGSVSDLADALIQYVPSGTDTNTNGTYSLEYRLKRDGGKYMTLPKKEFEPIYVIITEDNMA